MGSFVFFFSFFCLPWRTLLYTPCITVGFSWLLFSMINIFILLLLKKFASWSGLWEVPGSSPCVSGKKYTYKKKINKSRIELNVSFLLFILFFNMIF